MLEDRQDILKRQKEFYFELNAEEGCDDNMTEQFLNELNVKVAVELKEMLNKELRKEEFDQIVKSLKKNKSPGPDGIKSEFYIEYWHLIGDDVNEVIMDINTKGELTLSQYQALVILLYKKGIRESIENWRPLSLLNNDYKIWTKTLSNILKKVLPYIIHEDQRASVNGRKVTQVVEILMGVFC
jgi:hypothetical protein